MPRGCWCTAGGMTATMRGRGRSWRRWASTRLLRTLFSPVFVATLFLSGRCMAVLPVDSSPLFFQKLRELIAQLDKEGFARSLFSRFG